MGAGGRWRGGALAGVLVAVLGAQLFAAPPAAAEICRTTTGPATGPAFTVTLCLVTPSDGDVLTGTTEVTATATVDPPGAAVIDRVNFWWGPDTSLIYLLADHDAPYRMVLDTARFPDGPDLLRARVVMAGGFATDRLGSTVTISNPDPPPPDGETFTPWVGGQPGPGERFRLAAVGDGVDGSPESESVADLVDSTVPDAFAYLGDVYDRGTNQEFDTWYSDPNGYGRFTGITNPAIGNHEYMESPTAAPYFEFWDEVPHHYSYDVGGWHVIVLDSTVEFAQVAPGTPQYEWLAADLAANQSGCSLMYAHHARYTNVAGVNRGGLQPVWELLVDRGVTMILAGHAHTYERWQPMDRVGSLAAEGITQFVVGTGGRPILNPKGNDARVATEVTKPGALLLDLGPDDAEFTFTSADGQYTDAGTVPCRTAPEVTPTVESAQPGEDGWDRGDVALRWQVTDTDSPVTATGCEDQLVTTDQPPTTYTCSATSGGGTTGPVSVEIKRDGTPPILDPTVDPAQPDGSNGWYVSRPTVTFSCSDPLSGIANCPDPVEVDEGVSTVARSARDEAGNVLDVDVGPVSVDLTDPAVTCEPPSTFLLGDADATVGATVTDSGSGPARTKETVPVATTAVGEQAAALQGLDLAGRTSSNGCGYRVVYGFVGWAAPVDGDAVNVVNAGRTVPLRWRLLDAAGSPVTTLSSVRVTAPAHACARGATRDRLEEVAAGRSLLRNLGDGYYQYNWKTAKRYASSCRTMRADLGDGLLRTAEFRFRA